MFKYGIASHFLGRFTRKSKTIGNICLFIGSLIYPVHLSTFEMSHCTVFKVRHLVEF